MTSSMSSVAFSSDGVEVISRKTESGSIPRDRKTAEEINEFYELERCSKFITTNGYHRVALQFPDNYLCDSPQVALELRESTKQEVYIMADTSYGSCCVDEVASEHVEADCIIHYGPSCLTQTGRLPVMYIFGNESIDLEDCAAAFKELFPDPDDHLLVLYDTSYAHCIDTLGDMLKCDYQNCVFSTLVLPTPLTSGHTPSNVSTVASSTSALCGGCSCDCADRSVATNVDGPTDEGNGATDHEVESNVSTTTETYNGQQHQRFGRSFVLGYPLDSYKVFFIGKEGPTLTNLMLNYNKCQFYSYNPVSRVRRKETLSVNKALGRRYYLVQKAKEARTVGILVGTLGAAKYLDSIQRLKSIMKQAGKRFYTIAVGKLNVPKMANFLEIDVFVLVACPENSLLDSQEFFKPVVTPYEMEIACIRSRQWTGDYTTDFRELLPGAAFYVPGDQASDNEVEPEYSLISGGLLPTNEPSCQDDKSASSSALVQRSKMEVTLDKSAAASFLHQRSWQGLEQQLGQTDVTMATEGMSGVATGYTHEPSIED